MTRALAVYYGPLTSSPLASRVLTHGLLACRAPDPGSLLGVSLFPASLARLSRSALSAHPSARRARILGSSRLPFGRRPRSTRAFRVGLNCFGSARACLVGASFSPCAGLSPRARATAVGVAQAWAFPAIASVATFPGIAIHVVHAITGSAKPRFDASNNAHLACALSSSAVVFRAFTSAPVARTRNVGMGRPRLRSDESTNAGRQGYAVLARVDGALAQAGRPRGGLSGRNHCGLGQSWISAQGVAPTRLCGSHRRQLGWCPSAISRRSSQPARYRPVHRGRDHRFRLSQALGGSRYKYTSSAMQTAWS